MHPVSYTHLDVYKRQDETHFSRGDVEQALRAADVVIERVYRTPVSYTHLDVYKRQIEFCSAKTKRIQVLVRSR